MQTHAELLGVEFFRFRERVSQVLGILVSSQAEVWEVVEEVSENLITIFGIFSRVEDVLMPELVDGLRRNDLPLRVLVVQVEKLSVAYFHLAHLFEGPALTVFVVQKLHFDGAQVERHDFLQNFPLASFYRTHARSPLFMY